ncbi:MAG: HAMP domain-containing histidine kinase [Rhodocyclaceae bacterium]|nr:HAMP domain-containing histidine kinase [Rhodocyclaceae bacterium]
MLTENPALSRRIIRPRDESIPAMDCEGLALQSLLELNTLLSQRIEEETARVLEKEHLLMRQAHDAAMGEMIANIAHEWRQPLSSLGLIVQNLRYDSRDGLLDSQALECALDRAQLAIDEMATTINDFRIFFSRHGVEAPFGLLAAIRKCTDLMAASLKAHDIEIVVSGDEAMAEGRENEFLHAMLNVVANSKDALVERKSPRRRIEINVSHNDDEARVVLRDTAGGIDRNILDKVFEPYFTTKREGSGIGLYLTRTVIEQHMRGRVWADNWDEGARFHILLPAPARTVSTTENSPV